MKIHKKIPFFYGYIVLGAIWIVYFCNVGFVIYGAPAINAKMVQVLGFSSTSLGTAVSIWTIMQGVAGPLVGYITNKGGVRVPMMLGSLLLIIASGVLAYANLSENMFIIVYGIMIGFGIGMAGMISAQNVVNYWFNRKKAFAMALVLSAGGISGFIAPQIMKSVISRDNWRSGWILIGLMGLISFIVTYFLIINKPIDIGTVPDGVEPDYHPETVYTSSETTLSFRRVIKDKTIYLILLNFISRTALYYSFTGHIIPFLVQNSVQYSTAFYTISIVSITSLIGRFLVGIIPERFIKSNIELGVGNIVMAIGMLLIVSLLSIEIILLGSALFGLGLGFVYVALPLTISRFFGSENFAMINGNITPINYIVGAVGPLLVGVIADRTDNYISSYIILSLFTIVGGFSAFFSKKPTIMD